MEITNWKRLVIILLVAIAGIILVIGDTYWWETKNLFLVGIGCSLLASGLVSGLNLFLVEWQKAKPIDSWRMEKIYATRSEKNKDSDPKLKDLRYQLDGVAFGLKSFRTKQGREVEKALERGVNVRLITMQPDSPFVGQRELEEKEAPGQIQNTIRQLVEWANKLNAKGYKGKIQVKGYSCMTLDFYWRMDDELYMGPYWYGWDSQQTVTYKFVRGGQGFELYTRYFDELWNNDDITILLTEST